ncbi:MAG: hypothetical protein ABIJ41_03050 [Candidatus Omnitrophota bacterium]
MALLKGEVMLFKELLSKAKELKVEEIRKDDENYLEFVVRVSNLNQVHPLLEQYFGVPFKPAGQRPSREAQQHAAAFGGIREDQTLYFREQDNDFHCGMIWPWSDGELTTVKIARYERKK